MVGERKRSKKGKTYLVHRKAWTDRYGHRHSAKTYRKKYPQPPYG